MSAVALQESPSTHAAAAQDRRTHRRLAPAELAWIREARLKYGPAVSLIDLSPGGALVQTNVPLRPGTDLVIEIVGPRIETVPFRVLRSELAHISDEGAIYQGACQFKRNIDLAARWNSARDPEPLDAALKRLALLRRRSRSGRELRSGPLVAELRKVLTAAGSSGPAPDPLDRELCALLREVIPALDRGEPSALLHTRIEQHLRQSAASVALSIDAEPLAPQPDTETIYFGGSGGQHARVLNVQLAEGTRMPGWEFRLLQAASYLLELLPSHVETSDCRTPVLPGGPGGRMVPAVQGEHDSPTAQAAPGWQKIVVRYREGRLLKGFTQDFHPSRTQFSLWPSPDSAPADRMYVPISQLKAVFFVRDFDGDPEYDVRPVFDTTAEGRRLEVTFVDDEVLLGSTLGYRPDGAGFFVKPADTRGNNLRVFVVSGAIRHVRFF